MMTIEERMKQAEEQLAYWEQQARYAEQQVWMWRGAVEALKGITNEEVEGAEEASAE